MRLFNRLNPGVPKAGKRATIPVLPAYSSARKRVELEAQAELLNQQVLPDTDKVIMDEPLR
jgi:hypothetical protein